MDFKAFKEKITDKDVKLLVETMGGELRYECDKYMLFTSILYHKDANNHKPKMYWYKESRYFMDYKCGCGWDV